MTFKESVRTCLKAKYLTFSGRAPRSEYWWFSLFAMLAYFAIMAVAGVLAAAVAWGTGVFANGGNPGTVAIVLFGVIGLATAGAFIYLILPGIAVLVRRFHDVGISGWIYLLLFLFGLIPTIGGLASVATLVICVLKGTSGPNKFGADPLEFRTSADVFA